jgi:hypothetical protein
VFGVASLLLLRRLANKTSPILQNARFLKSDSNLHCRLRVSGNVRGLAKVGFRKHQSSNLVQKLIENTNVQPSTKATLTQNQC